MQFSLYFTTVGSAPEIKVQILHQNKVVGQFECDDTLHQVTFDVGDTNIRQDQTVAIQMSGKQDKHTTIDNHYNIIQDSHIQVEKIIFNGVDVTEIFCQGFQSYLHDCNGSSQINQHKFYGYMGCNGQVNLDFYTPLYRWYLDHTN